MSELTHVDVGAEWLAHHGIQGQKWGVQNGPPYPIEPGEHSAAEKRFIAKKEKTANKIDRMYSKQISKNEKKIAKYESKGKQAKASILKKINEENQKASASKIKSIRETDVDSYKKAHGKDVKSDFFKNDFYTLYNKSNMTTTVSRHNEKAIQKQMRNVLALTRDLTLEELSVEEGYEFVRRKAQSNLLENMAYSAGAGSH